MDVYPSTIAKLLLTSFLAILGCSCSLHQGSEITTTKQAETEDNTSTATPAPPDLTEITFTSLPIPSLTSTPSPRPSELPTTTPTLLIIISEKLTSLTITQTLEHSESVTEVAFSPDNSILATSAAYGIIRLWQVKDGALLFVLDGHSNIFDDGALTVWFS